VEDLLSSSFHKHQPLTHLVLAALRLCLAHQSKVVSGGSIMGEQFVDMCEKEKNSDIGANFLSFASGQELIKRMTGSTSKVVKPRKHQQRLGTSASAYDKGMLASFWLSFCLGISHSADFFSYRFQRKNLEVARGKLVCSM
jgi:hypothetical protein